MQRDTDSVSRRRLIVRFLVAAAVTLALTVLFRSAPAGPGVAVLGGVAILFGVATLALPLLRRVPFHDVLLLRILLPLLDAAAITAAAVFATPYAGVVFPLYVPAALDHGVYAGIKPMLVFAAASLAGVALALVDYSSDLVIAAVASILVPLLFVPLLRRLHAVQNEAAAARTHVERLNTVRAAVHDRLQVVSARIADLLNTSRSKAETNLLQEAYESTNQMLEAAGAAARTSGATRASDRSRADAVRTYQPSTPLKILIVDDNATNLMVLKRILLSAGYVVTATSSGREALAAITTGDYAAAVIDMHMPGFDGLAVVRQFRRDHPRSTLAIIVVTADESFDAQSGSADAGADAYLNKPVKPAKLLSTIKQVLRARKVVYLARGQRVPEGAAPVLDEDTFREIRANLAERAELDTLVRIFEGEMEQLLRGIQQARADSDEKSLGDALAAARAAALSIGAFRLAKGCETLKTAVTGGADIDADTEVAVLREEYRAAVKRLREIVKRG